MSSKRKDRAIHAAISLMVFFTYILLIGFMFWMCAGFGYYLMKQN